MIQKNKLCVYITHDTEDAELVSLLVDALSYTGIFDVLLSPFGIPRLTPSFDFTMKDNIESCDVMIAIFTRRSSRWTLVEQEIEFAKTRNKILVPLIEKPGKIRKIGTLLHPYVAIMFDRRDVAKAASEILERIHLAQTAIGVPEELVLRAMSVLKTYSEQPSMLRASKLSRLAIFRRIVVEALENLGYSVKELGYSAEEERRFGFYQHKGFNLEAVKKERTTYVNCLLRKPTKDDVERATFYKSMHKSELSEVWIVCAISQNMKSITEVKGVNIVPIQALLEELDSSDKKSLTENLAQIIHAEALTLTDSKLLSELKDLIKTVAKATTPYQKGRALERLADCFIDLFPGLEVLNKNVRIEAQELDLVVKNENPKIFWQRLGTPIIVECKNWTKPVGASEVGDLIRKMREVRTAFLFASHGVTSKDGAHYEIIEARKKNKFILVFDLSDINDIINGANPEDIVQDRFYSLWTIRAL